MSSPRGPSLRELAVQALSSVEGGYDRLAPKFDRSPFRTSDGVLDATADALRPGGVFAFPAYELPPVTSRRYWTLLGFDTAMRVRNAVWRPPFVMYYRTWPPPAVRDDLTASGFTVTTVPLPLPGRRGDGSLRYRLVLARRPDSPAAP